jgi:hypothetical protein
MSFDPENDLERSLVKAANDPVFTPQFYRDLARADIFIIQHGKQVPEKAERIIALEGETIQIQNIEHRGKLHTPFFSSLTRLRAVLDSKAAYLGINALAFLELTKGSALLLNPGSEYGKEITAKEAALILNGSIWQPSERFVVQKKTQVMLGHPANYPVELVAALTRLFKSKKQVKRAWLAHFLNPERDKHPHTLVAIETTGSYDEIAAEVGMVASHINMPDPPLDLIQITGQPGEIGDYFLKETKPFYERRFLGLF